MCEHVFPQHTERTAVQNNPDLLHPQALLHEVLQDHEIILKSLSLEMVADLLAMGLNDHFCKDAILVKGPKYVLNIFITWYGSEQYFGSLMRTYKSRAMVPDIK